MTPRTTLRVLLTAVGVTMTIMGLVTALSTIIEFLIFREYFAGHLLAMLVSPILWAAAGFQLALFADVPAKWFCPGAEIA